MIDFKSVLQEIIIIIIIIIYFHNYFIIIEIENAAVNIAKLPFQPEIVY